MNLKKTFTAAATLTLTAALGGCTQPPPQTSYSFSAASIAAAQDRLTSDTHYTGVYYIVDEKNNQAEVLFNDPAYRSCGRYNCTDHPLSYAAIMFEAARLPQALQDLTMLTDDNNPVAVLRASNADPGLYDHYRTAMMFSDPVSHLSFLYNADAPRKVTSGKVFDDKTLPPSLKDFHQKQLAGKAENPGVLPALTP